MVQADGVRMVSRGVWLTGSLAIVTAIAALVLLTSGLQAPAVLEDDVTHDGQMAKMFGSQSAGARGRKALRANSSIQDFFHAAMRGDFENGKKVKLATNGLFDNQKEHRKAARAEVPQKGSKQQLAEGKLRLKAAHLALAKHAHSEAHQDKLHRMERPMQVHFARSREAAIRAKYPTEDRFVARYTGAIPNGDVVVDTFTGGPYVPI